jgi:hypothetical protein
MMLRVSLLTLISALSAAPAFAQSPYDSSGAPGLRSGDLAATGSGRQQPNMQPSAGSGPINSQAASTWPNAAPPFNGYDFAGGTLQVGVTTATVHDDNVFAARTNRLSDTFFVARPEFSWINQGEGYGVGVDGYVEARRYVQFESENQVNGSIGGNFTLMPDADTQVVGSARYIHAHLERGTSETIGPGGLLLSTVFNRPIAYDQGIGAVALNKRYDRWWTSLGVAGVAIKYQDPSMAGIAVDLSYANGGIGVANGRLGYVIAPQTSVFVEAAGNTRDWQVNVFDSTGYRTVAGVLFEPGRNARLKGEVWAGYMNQTYSGASFQNISNWTYGASMAFRLTDQLTGTIEGKREAKEAALSLAFIAPNVLGANATVCSITPGAVCVSAIESSVSGRLDYRILPNVVVGGGASFVVDDYLGAVSANRKDRTLSPLASIKYIPNDRLTFGFDYRRINFDPSGGQGNGVNAISYYRDVYLLSANGKF